MTSRIGRVIDGRYRLVEAIGEGGMGSVYAAEHTRIRRRVAIKLLNTDQELKEERLARFFREAQAASEIGHPNIIEIFDVGIEDDGTAFIIMEVLEGQALGERLRQQGTLAPEVAAPIVLQILSALEAAHAKRIVHRDLKPDNVFLALDAKGREEVKLLDFGVSKVQEPSGVLERVELTKEGVVLGTPLYLSPEQARGQTDVDHRIDIWAVGVMFYEMLSGCMPFDGKNYNEVLTKILTEPPEPLDELVPELPEPLLAVVNTAMASWRDDRYGTAAEMIEALLAVHSEAPMTSAARVALQNSIPPPPSTEGEGLDSTPGARPSARGVGPLDNTLTALADTEYQGRSTADGSWRRSRFAWLLAGGVALVGAAVLVVVLSDAPESPASSSPPPPPPAAQPSEMPAPPVESAAAASSATARPEAADDPEAAEEVTIELTNVPHGAGVTLDGQPVVSPFTVPQSTEEVLIEVTAGGYLVYRKAVVPDEDQTIPVVMRRMPRTPRRRPPGQATPASTSQRGSRWADNPFVE